MTVEKVYNNRATVGTNHYGDLTKLGLNDFNNRTPRAKSFVSDCCKLGAKESSAGRFVFGVTMSDLIKAIPTKYQGYEFRSRLEARWAVFFDTLEIQYNYEPEGFDVTDVFKAKHPTKTLPPKNELWYLPDFYLPDYGWYVEIKAEIPDPKVDRSMMKCFLFSESQKFLVLCGTPGVGSYEAFTDIHIKGGLFTGSLAEGRKCDRLWLVNEDRQFAMNCDNCWSPKCGDKMTTEHAGMEDAYNAARQYKFH